ncbi:MAG: glycosyltransferase [Planctomycetota bacterium]
MKPTKVSIIAPLHNEEENVATTVAKIREAFDAAKEDWEFVCVDDGSLDGTRKALEAEAAKDPRVRIVSYSPRRGRGYALRQGFAAARGAFVVTTDFDLSYGPDQLLSLLKNLRADPGMDIALASAYMEGGAVEGVPGFRLFLSKFGNSILRHALGGQIRTATCIVRAYRREALSALELFSTGKEIHLEILSKALALGLSVGEFPATLRGRTKGKSKFKFRETTLSHLGFCISERPMLLFGVLGGLSLLGGFGVSAFLLFKYVAQFFGGGELHPDRPLVPIALVLILGGLIMLGFGFLSVQANALRREVLGLSRRVRSLEEPKNK